MPVPSGTTTPLHEPPAQPRGQDRRPRRGDVRPRLPHPGPPGRDRAQAGARDGRAQDRLGVAHLRAQRVRRVAGHRGSPALRRGGARGHRRALRLPARARPPREARAGQPPADQLRHRRAPAPGRVRHPGAARARGGGGGRAGRPRPHDGLLDRGPRAGGAAGLAQRPRAAARCCWPRASATRSAPGGATIGRSRECDIVLADSNVSRRHAELRPLGDGWSITDLGSTNGVRVNGRDLRPNEPQPLQSGDRVDVGTVDARFEVD